MIKVVLADDHVIVRNGIKALLDSEPQIQVAGEASNGQEALNVCANIQPDVLIIDIRMPVMDGIEATRRLRDYSVNTRSLVLSMHDTEEYVLQSISCGAYGYLLKDTGREEFVKAIQEVNKGRRYFSSAISNVLVDNYLNTQKKNDIPKTEPEAPDLTPKEREILEQIALGRSNKEIAEALDKSVRTVETQRFKLMKKLDVKNVVELMNLIKEKKLISEDFLKDS